METINFLRSDRNLRRLLINKENIPILEHLIESHGKEFKRLKKLGIEKSSALLKTIGDEVDFLIRPPYHSIGNALFCINEALLGNQIYKDIFLEEKQTL